MYRSVLGDPSEVAFSECLQREHGWIPPGQHAATYLLYIRTTLCICADFTTAKSPIRERTSEAYDLAAGNSECANFVSL